MDTESWISVISGIVGVVLAIVAMWFAVMVDGRSRKVTDQTIRSLQKIESSVERQSSDTQDLIKAGWDRMLGTTISTNGIGPGVPGSETATLAAGIAAELRQTMFPKTPDQPDTETSSRDQTAIIREMFDEAMEELLSLGTVKTRFAARPTSDVDRWIAVLRDLSPVAFELGRALGQAHGHLEHSQYVALGSVEDFRRALRELRAAGIIAPLAAREDPDGPPVYWFPPGLSATLSAAYTLSDRAELSARSRVVAALERVGYGSKRSDAKQSKGD